MLFCSLAILSFVQLLVIAHSIRGHPLIRYTDHMFVRTHIRTSSTFVQCVTYWVTLHVPCGEMHSLTYPKKRTVNASAVEGRVGDFIDEGTIRQLQKNWRGIPQRVAEHERANNGDQGRVYDAPKSFRPTDGPHNLAHDALSVRGLAGPLARVFNRRLKVAARFRTGIRQQGGILFAHAFASYAYNRRKEDGLVTQLDECGHVI